MDFTDLVRAMSWRLAFRKVVSDPLVHFAIVGWVIFSLYSGDAFSDGRVVISNDRTATLVQQFSDRMGREPSGVELTEILRGELEDEALFREALNLGLERSDVIVRRRLVQKMRFLLEDLSPVTEPTPEELQDVLHTNPDRYAHRERFVLEHYATRRPGQANALLTRLRSGLDVSSFAEPTALGTRIEGTRTELEQRFGRALVELLRSQPPGQWFGPVESPRGPIVARVELHEPRREGSLEDPRVRDAVKHDLQTRKRAKAVQQALAVLIEEHGVAVEASHP